MMTRALAGLGATGSLITLSSFKPRGKHLNAALFTQTAFGWVLPSTSNLTTRPGGCSSADTSSGRSNSGPKRCLRIGSLPEKPTCNSVESTPLVAKYEFKSTNFKPSSTISQSSISAMVPAASSLLLIALAGIAFFPLPAEAFTLQDAVNGLEAAVASAGPLGPVLFILAYSVATVFLIPASLLTVGAGFLFGPVLGTVVVSIASTMGAIAAFLVGRYLARPVVAKRAAEDKRFAAVDAAIAAQGAKIVLLLRLSPLFPFGLLNYGLSLTNIPLASYVGASWAGMLPGTIAYVALGGAGKAAAETAAGAGTPPLQLALYAIGALATLGATVLISRAASQALKEASQLEEPLQGAGRDKSDD